MNEIILSKEFLESEYIDKQKSMNEIASECSVSIGTVFNRIHRYGIPTRDLNSPVRSRRLSEAKRGKPSPLKGKPKPESMKRKLSEQKKGVFKKPSEFGGFRKKQKDGYISVFAPNVSARKDGTALEHRLVMEKHLGRRLRSDEVVHHINGLRDDNRIENLAVMTLSEHTSMHMIERHKKRREKKQ